MKLLEKLKKKKKKMQDQMQRGRVVTEQIKAEKLRKKGKRKSLYEPGTIRYGLVYKQNPLDMMKDAKCRREQRRKEREEKH